ncbi:MULTISPECIES: ABC-type transport auxiliary lipoprotein family protein [Stenotrophomonas]|jgi:cholesterol transport system auxiliary component|uniref:ABC-type transport auxiliary lipoprotein family protein n=1 Tax=Stenotrophomonas TaxID=40323 RepID=UPI000703A964|nr:MULTISPECIES: ABC-type transport auxiliary lipoprotein family protein [Stenotrophomonas]ODU44274.1 MAG: ABC transporter [Xanthomonadaceae bacterium SCN 69-123]OJY80586.1 MAG: ABC transporter [Stenotrophomonas sp. 69-14]OZB52973.1 MAG: ABC transporter [Stenotrophomonas sp. 14-69-23]KRG86505.1 ABC transporter [Stenotrophomonas acidaminiphila]MCA7023345.1 ABC-type transport auxiliary lipoprotein family protein [Stenotrophomonas acidaminiphila]
MKRFPSMRLLAPLCVLALAGCSVLASGDRHPITIYAPQARVAVDPSWPRVDWQLAVAKPAAARLVDSPRINVRPTPGELEVYRGATWSQPATDMLEDALLRGFEDSGRIGAVARIATGIRSDYKLAIDLRRFESDYAGNARPAATIELNAKLIHSLDQRVVASRTFLVAEPAADTTVASVTTAFETALGRTTGELIGWTLAAGQADWQAHPDQH